MTFLPEELNEEELQLWIVLQRDSFDCIWKGWEGPDLC